MKRFSLFCATGDEGIHPMLQRNVLSIDDLKPGMILSGTVLNVAAFGAFIDIGVKEAGLLRITNIPRGTQLGVGNILSVEIISVDKEHKRIILGWMRSIQ